MFLKVLETIFPSGSQNASNTSPVYESSQHIERPVPTSQWPVCLQSIVLVIQGLGTALLALINSLLVLLTIPQCLHSSGACSLLVYLDPGLSLLAVVVLIATAMPQVRLCVFMSRPKQQFGPLIKSSLRRIFAPAVSRPALTSAVVSLATLSRCAGMDCCCYRPHLHTFVYLILNRGLRASLVCRLCTTYTFGS